MLNPIAPELIMVLGSEKTEDALINRIANINVLYR